MDIDVFKTVVVPTLTTGAAFIGITTLGGETNFVNKLIDIKNQNGDHIYKSIVMQTSCEDCIRANKAMDCTCKIGERPHWQSMKRQEDIQKIMEDDKETYLIEARLYFIYLFIYYY